MNFWELIKARRSVRKFDPKRPVTEEEVNKILEAGTWAPSSGNTQCWRFYVIWDPQLKADLAIKAGHQPFISDAPVLIAVVADLDRVGRGYGSRGREMYSLQDTAAAIQNMFLAITELGLSTCWIGAFNDERAAQLLGLGPTLRPVAMLPVGYGLESPNPPPRRPVSEVTKVIGSSSL